MWKLFLFMLSATTIAQAQNVGIGKINPQVRLDVASTSNNPARFDGASPMFIGLYEGGTYRGYMGSFAGSAADVDFGTGVGNTTGKLHLSIQAEPKLTIRENGYVGINNTNPQWHLDVEGGMRLNGRFYINGTSGSIGQVLTSGGGVNKPSWQTLSVPFDNNVRFSFTCSDPNNTFGDMNIGTRYNTNPEAVVVSGTNITINSTGIYHFEVAISGRVDYSSALGYEPSFFINLFVSGGMGAGNNPVANTPLYKNGTFNRYTGTAFASTDFYLTAGQTIKVSFSYGSTPAGFTEIDSFGYLRGYKISD